MLLMFEKGIRGGITQAVKRYVKANNKYMKDLYNPDEERIHLEYVNANNPYGWAMVQNLPAHGFLWKEAGDFTPEKIDDLVKKDKRGYLLEVDVKYQTSCKEWAEKLVPNLKNKTRYVVHIKALDQTLKQSLKLKKVHRVIEFQHSKWIKAYIMLKPD